MLFRSITTVLLPPDTEIHNQTIMPSIMRTAGLFAGLAAIASALPAQPKLTPRQEAIYELTKRQTAAEAALGLQDVDILQL